MVTSALGPRVLLRRLREVMAEPVTAQKRLDKIVSLIAANMVAEVCSIYVMRPGRRARALRHARASSAKRCTNRKLKIGEGLVGTIAGQAIGLNLADAHTHPAFKYLPETGEEIYHSFLGVPIMRGGTVIGVLVVQNRTRRHYSEEEEEALQTTAMVLAEVIASGELKEVAREVAADVAHMRSHHLRGEALAEGVALGHAVLHEPRVRDRQPDRREHSEGEETARRGGGAIARPCRCAGRRLGDPARRRLFRRARDHPHVRPRQGLGHPAARGRRYRPHGGGSGRAGAERQPGPHDAHSRSLFARAHARSRRSGESAAAHSDRGRRHRLARRPAAERHRRGAQHGPRRASRLRPRRSCAA